MGMAAILVLWPGFDLIGHCGQIGLVTKLILIIFYFLFPKIVNMKILCLLPQKGRTVIEDIVEAMKERVREERETGLKVKKQKK